LGWDARPNESYTDVLLRAALINRLGDFGDHEIIAEANRRFRRFLEDAGSLPGDLRPAVMNIVGRNADRATYEQLHELARKSGGLEEKQLFYGAMQRALEPNLADRTLQLALTDELAPIYAARLVAGVADRGEQPERAWNFARQHMPQLLAKVPFARRNGYVPSIFAAFSEASRADELENYVKANLPADALKKAEEIADDIRFRYTFKQRTIRQIDDWVRHGANAF
jgi:aminopeptidase N